MSLRALASTYFHSRPEPEFLGRPKTTVWGTSRSLGTRPFNTAGHPPGDTTAKDVCTAREPNLERLLTFTLDDPEALKLADREGEERAA